MTIPARIPRRLMNLSATRPALIHLSMAATAPVQSWVNGRFTPVEQPLGAIGQPHPERLCRNNPSSRFELAPKARFQDLFSAELGSEGICGGYGIFEPGARLPCHRHEFDESITIVQGMATCVVEGRRHELTANATALVPQGLCHYFINLTLAPMAMVWVYAGDKPDRIVMDESYCHPETAQEIVRRQMQVDFPMQNDQHTHLTGFQRMLTRLVGFTLLLVPASVFGDGPVLTGEQIYRQKCASCHGPTGEGTEDHYPRPLIGERPVASLARLIAKTMPEDAPGECVGEDAQKVAAYIYETFLFQGRTGAQQIPASADRALAIDRAAVSQRSDRLDRKLSQRPVAGTNHAV